MFLAQETGHCYPLCAAAPSSNIQASLGRITEVARHPAFSVLLANAVPHDKQRQGAGGSGIRTRLICSADANGTNVLLPRAQKSNVHEVKICPVPEHSSPKMVK